MKTIAIGTNGNSSALSNTLVTALADGLGWTVNSGKVQKEGVGIYFQFSGNTSAEKLIMSNGYATIENSIPFSAANTYNLYVLKSAEGTVAVGLGVSGEAPALTSIIAPNAAGEYVGLACIDDAWKSIRGNDTAGQDVMTITPVATGGVSTSIVRLPDIRGACMFKDLYAVVSCPFQSTDRAFYADGKYYRTCNTMGTGPSIAIPEE